MPRPRYRRTPDHTHPVTVPTVLPLVAMTVDEDGTMTVTVDGTPYLPPPFAPSWVRGSFATILDQLTTRHPTPLRVEVREADGSTFTDIITPATPRRPIPDALAAAEVEPTAPNTAPAPASVPPELVVMRGDGFVPGEDVAIAVVIAHSDAAPDGSARSLLTPDQVAASPTREVILLGRVSGTVTVGHPA